jgi:hypothetical protein
LAIRSHYGWYSNKSRGIRQGKNPATGGVTPDAADEYWEKLEPDTAFRKKCRMTWAALIKCVFEVDPLKCPCCGGQMKIVSFIEEPLVIEKILRHCKLWMVAEHGRSKEAPPRAPPKEPELKTYEEPALDYGFFGRTCI